MWSRSYAVNVPGSPSDVFAYVTDLARHPEWSPTPLRVEPEAAGAPTVGSRFRGIGQTRGQEVVSEGEITELDPPRRFAFVATSPSTVMRHEFRVEPTAEGARVERRLTLVRARRPLLRVAWPLVARRVIWPQVTAAMERLREVLSART